MYFASLLGQRSLLLHIFQQATHHLAGGAEIGGDMLMRQRQVIAMELALLGKIVPQPFVHASKGNLLHQADNIRQTVGDEPPGVLAPRGIVFHPLFYPLRGHEHGINVGWISNRPYLLFRGASTMPREPYPAGRLVLPQHHNRVDKRHLLGRRLLFRHDKLHE